jgi:DNA-binding transcriptional MerR regulator
MFTIGEFAQLTEITVKALHHYDEVGVLRPAEVDPVTRYRRYAADQLRPALLLRALRDADVPLSAVTGVADPTTAVAALDRHRAERLAAREAEDRAHDRAQAVIAALAVTARVEVRDAPEQAYLGTVIKAADAEGMEEANDEFRALYSAAAELGTQPTGQFWSILRAGENDAVELVLCVAVGGAVAIDPAAEPAAAGSGERTAGSAAGSAAGDAAIERATLPRRRELVTAWDGDQSGLVEGVLHPAVVAIFEEVENRGLNTRLDHVRQVVLPNGGVEVVTTLETLDAD